MIIAQHTNTDVHKKNAIEGNLPCHSLPAGERWVIVQCYSSLSDPGPVAEPVQNTKLRPG